LAKRPASEIDLSDAPELDAEGWKNAVQGGVRRSDTSKGGHGPPGEGREGPRDGRARGLGGLQTG